MPEISPPPPIGVTKVSIAGTSSSISIATVPWPAMTAESSNGWTKVKPRSRLELAGMGIGGVEGVAVQHDGRRHAPRSA